MSNTINPLGASRSNLSRSVQPSDIDEDGGRQDAKRVDLPHAGTQANKDAADQASARDAVNKALTHEPANVADPGARTAARFGSTLEGAIDRVKGNDVNQQQVLDGLSADEQQLIYRYFPASPSLELRLYKPDMSTDKVDPGSVGSRVDLRG
ncbi:MAG: hypothetical protein AAF564_19190 [Bacteroidota bacterium]